MSDNASPFPVTTISQPGSACVEVAGSLVGLAAFGSIELIRRERTVARLRATLDRLS